jgi:hypothetical protein
MLTPRVRSCLLAVLSVLVSAGLPAQTYAQAPATAATPDLSGIWARVVDPATRSFYLYAFDAAEPAMTPWGEARYKETKPSHGARGVPLEATNDPVFNGCNPPGVPRVYLHPFPFQIVNVPGREIIILYEYDHLVRHVYTNRTEHDTRSAPTWMGDSIGRWEGDTFIVDTIGFNDQTWIDRRGLPHGEELHVVERFRRVGNTLEVGITVEDPQAYVRPWSVQLRYTLRPPEWRILELACEDDASFMQLERLTAQPAR